MVWISPSHCNGRSSTRSRWTPSVVYTRQVWNACTAGTLLAFRTLHVKTNIATLTGSIGIRIQLPALFARALKITHAALEFLLAASIARTLHTGIGLVAVRIVAAFLADATYAYSARLSLAMVVAMTIGIPPGTTIHRGEQPRAKTPTMRVFIDSYVGLEEDVSAKARTESG